MADTELQQLAKTDRNPVQETRYQELLRANGGQINPTGSASGLDTTSIIKNATALQDFYKQQNEPVIQSYEASKTPLNKRYSDLLASIKQNQQTAENRQTVTTQNELGKRGLTSSSGLAQTEMTNALNPITQQYTQLQKDTTNQQNIDLAAIDKAIAQLQAGNPSESVSAATSIANAIQSANQFQQQLEATQQQNAISNALAQSQANQTTTAIVEVGGRKKLINTQTGAVIADLGSTSSSTTSGSDDVVSWLQSMLNA